MGLGERAKPSNSSVSTTRIRPLSGPHWPWMLLQALSALRSGPRLQHLVQLHIRTDCGPQGHQLKNPSTVVHAQFARLQLSQWDRHRGTQCASVRCSIAKCALSPSPPCKHDNLPAVLRISEKSDSEILVHTIVHTVYTRCVQLCVLCVYDALICTMRE